MYEWREQVEVGALMSYGSSLVASSQRIAVCVVSDTASRSATTHATPLANASHALVVHQVLSGTGVSPGTTTPQP